MPPRGSILVFARLMDMSFHRWGVQGDRAPTQVPRASKRKGRDSIRPGSMIDTDGMHEPLPPRSIILIDRLCWGIISTAPMILLIAVLIKVTGTVPGKRGGPDRPVDPEVASSVLACAVALVLLAAGFVALRVKLIQSMFEHGREVEASVRKVTYLRGGRTKLQLEFELYGELHEVRHIFVRSRRTPTFGENTQIQVLVDPDRPKRVFPLALYGTPTPAVREHA